MIKIKPISDLRNNFTELEKTIIKDNEPIFLTKNGYGTMVLMSIDYYSQLTSEIDKKLLEADLVAEKTTVRYNENEVFDSIRGEIIEKYKL